ncbi:MAG: hypothetical protein ACFFCI_00600 [Promethearchaeota archaeon]
MQKPQSNNTTFLTLKNLALQPSDILISSFQPSDTQLLFDDDLEFAIFSILLKKALDGNIGATSALLADQTSKTKNTVNVRLERLYYKRLISKREIGNALLYFFPIQTILYNTLETIAISETKELILNHIKNYINYAKEGIKTLKAL